jgi:hypothetical protein
VYIFVYVAKLPFFGTIMRGEMAEWSKAAVLKTVEDESPPWVRIPLSPHKTLGPKAYSFGAFCFTEEMGFERRSRYTRRAERVLVGESGSRALSRIGAQRTIILSDL